jgi:WXXGXW repeat (2 copies)
MTRTWMAVLAVAGGLTPAMFGQQYPQQYAPGQVDPSVNRPNRSAPYDNGQYTADPSYPAYDGGQPYDGSQGDYAPAPPPVPNYAYQRPPMPGPGYFWVDGYWNFTGRRYSWVAGYWMMPPYAEGYWVTPRYTSGRFFRGYWAGPRRDFDRGFRQPQQSYRTPAPRGSAFADHGRDSRSANRGQRQGRR